MNDVFIETILIFQSRLKFLLSSDFELYCFKMILIQSGLRPDDVNE